MTTQTDDRPTGAVDNTVPDAPAAPSRAEVLSGEQLDAREHSAFAGLLRAHTRMMRMLEAEMVAAHALSLNAYDVLLWLHNAGRGLRMAELADTVLLDRRAPNGLVNPA